jgi:hypothetical protein
VSCRRGRGGCEGAWLRRRARKREERGASGFKTACAQGGVGKGKWGSPGFGAAWWGKRRMGPARSKGGSVTWADTARTRWLRAALMSHPVLRKRERSLHTCAQDVQITRTANNMVNRYNISLNYKLESLQNGPWVQKTYYRVAWKSKCRCIFHRHNRRRGRPSLCLLPPAGTLGFDSNI